MRRTLQFVSPPPVVLHVAQPTDGGVARCVVAYTRRQLEDGWRVQVACPDGLLAHDLGEARIPVLRWTAGRSPGPSTPGEIHRLRRLIGEVGPDLLHLHSSKAGLAGRIAVRGRRPTIFQPHGWSFAASTGTTKAMAVRWERASARWADRVVCVSEQERHDGERTGVEATWAVVPNGVDLTRFVPVDDAARARLRTALELPVGAPVAVTVGRLVKMKGHGILLDAWRRVVSKLPHARLLIIGDGPDRAVLEARREPGVMLVGERADVAQLLALADVYVHPSISEAMSLAVLEAMASGRSIVATDVGGAREAVLGGVGAVVPANDVAALADAVLVRLEDLQVAEREGARARAVAETLFDGDRATARISALALEVLGR